MSDSDSEFGNAQDRATPQTPGEVAKEIFVRILAGLGAVGRGLRGGFVGTATCVQHNFYPLKEGCLHGIDKVNAYLHPRTARGGGAAPTADVVHFAQGSSDEEREGTHENSGGSNGEDESDNGG